MVVYRVGLEIYFLSLSLLLSYFLKVKEQQEQLENLCLSIRCDYPGSYCSIEDGQPKCICDAINCVSDNIKVCGEDGQTYASYCDLIKFSCAKQTNIATAYAGQCSQCKLFSNKLEINFKYFSYILMFSFHFIIIIIFVANLIYAINNNNNNKNGNRELKKPRNKSTTNTYQEIATTTTTAKIILQNDKDQETTTTKFNKHSTKFYFDKNNPNQSSTLLQVVSISSSNFKLTSHSFTLLVSFVSILLEQSIIL